MTTNEGRATFRKVEPVRMYQRIVTQVEEAVLKGELHPGDHLPSEREMVAQFGTSRSTVREALRVLESNGVIRSRPGDPHGPEVLPFSSDALSRQLTRLTRVEGLSLAELLGFRMILDGSAARMAARLRTDEQLAELEATIVAMEEALDKGFHEFSESDVAFHDVVARASRNTLIDVCQQVVRRAVVTLIEEHLTRTETGGELRSESLRHHTEVFEAIRAGDAAAAARISRRNLYNYYSGYVPEHDLDGLRALLLEDTGSSAP